MRRAVLGKKKEARMGIRKMAGKLVLSGLAVALVGCGGGAGQGEAPSTGPQASETSPVLAQDEVRAIMEHAAKSVDRDLLIAVTDRRGVILGVAGNFDLNGLDCSAPFPAPGTDCGSADLAVQLARAASFFSADQTPLTSRSVRFISGEHFPPGIQNSGAAALFGIENTNRGCSFDANRDDALYNSPDKVIPRARSLAATLVDLSGGAPLACESGGGREGCTTGIATLPGGVAIFKNGRMAGGVGVAVRGVAPVPDPVAAFDSPSVLRRQDGDPDYDVGEFAARAFAGDVKRFVRTVVNKGLTNVCFSTDIAPPACCTATPTPCTFSILPLPIDRSPIFDPVIFIDGIEVAELANDPPVPENVSPVAGRDLRFIINPTVGPSRASFVPGGYLVGPQAAIATPAGGAAPLTAAEVDAIVQAARKTAQETRAGIRLPLEERSAMIIAVSDTDGNLLAVFRMDDATVFSIDVAVAKSRNVVYFSNPNINPLDTLDTPAVGDARGQAFPPGTAITNRTISFGSQPFFPSGIDGSDPGPFRRVFLDDSSIPCTNGLEPPNGRQNGIVFFPGSVPLYRDGVMIGGLGISGDGVEQDDIVSNGGANAAPGFEPPSSIRADNVFVRGVRLPYLKFNRQPNQ